MSKIVFHVSRATKTSKAVNVGDFDTVSQAQDAMLEHYKKTPKRGKSWYNISEEELKEINGVVFREFCTVLSDGNNPYFKRFTADELKAMADRDFGEIVNR